MRKLLRRKFKDFRKETKSHKLVYLPLFAILVLALFVRVYNVGEILGFYFDQGRDALVIWDLWHKGKPFLIGPVTGLPGIFLGPFYYYLIAPFYLIGNGNPVFPAIFLALFSTLAVVLIYYLGWKMHSRSTGLIAAIIASFSYYLVLSGRWLSNPTPILLTSMILLLAMWKIIESLSDKSKFKSTQKWWMVIAATVGISLHFESASAAFYIPVVIGFYLWLLFSKNKKGIPNIKTIILSSLIFFLTLSPQIAFNFRHDNLLFNNFQKLFIAEKGFDLPTEFYLNERSKFFQSVFTSKIFPGHAPFANIFYLTSLIGIIWYGMRNRKAVVLLLFFLGVPIVGYILFRGNFGVLYDYYLTGYYLPFILLFAIGLGQIWKSSIPGKIIIAAFFVTFLNINFPLIKNYLALGQADVNLGNQLKAVNWVYDNAASYDNFNLDIYVPPVIPHAYDYLFLWQGSKRCGENLCGLKKTDNLETLYILHEQDSPNPDRLENWLSKYKDNTLIIEEEIFGGITVQRRKRL